MVMLTSMNASADDVDNRTFVSMLNNNSLLEIRRLLFAVILPIFIVFGTYGNAVSFYVTRRGSMKKVSTCFFLAILAIADSRE